MRILICAVLVSMLPMSGCSTPTGAEKFEDRHPEYDHRPSYFDKRETYGGDPVGDPSDN